MSNDSKDTKRIAKNTLFLYFRMFLLMAVGLYTSRITLQALGVDDYGVYSVIGGFVMMFGMLSGSLSNAISRFILVELGRNNQQRLQTVFSSSVSVQIILAVIVFVLAEIIGCLFLFYKMNIDPERINAAFWVLQCSILTFCLGLAYVPYNATIIAHERMKAFAYISLLEAGLKLAVSFVLFLPLFDRLIVYAILLFVVQLLLRSIYVRYCTRNFSECRYSFHIDIKLLKEMSGFAGWNFFGESVQLLNNQGIDILINLHFGVVLNAAKGIANQVNTALQQFVVNFMTAITPQITKSYAANDKKYAFQLACIGSKFSFFLMFILALPVLMETDIILDLWLVETPDYAVSFIRWIIIGSLTKVIAQTMFTLQMAEGNIKKYQIIVSCIASLTFPLSCLAFYLNYPPMTPFIIYSVVSLINIFVRYYIVRGTTGFPFVDYIIGVVVRSFAAALVAVILPCCVVECFEPSYLRLIASIVTCLISAVIFAYFIGLSKLEQQMVIRQILRLKNRLTLFTLK